MSWEPGVTLDMMEKEAIESALAHYKGNKEKAADALGISRKTIYNKLERYGIENKKDEEKADARAKAERDYVLKSKLGPRMEGDSMFGTDTGESAHPSTFGKKKSDRPVVSLRAGGDIFEGEKKIHSELPAGQQSGDEPPNPLTPSKDELDAAKMKADGKSKGA